MEKLTYKIADKNDYNGIFELTTKIHGEDAYFLADDLLNKSDKKDSTIFFISKDTETDQVVGELCIIDFPIMYHGIEIKGAELGIVATDENYRNMGISTKLTNMFFEKGKELDYDLYVIEGIPYFYRRYGFDYATRMGGESLNIKNINFEQNPDYKFRKAEITDIDFIHSEFFDSHKNKPIYSVYDKEIIHAQSFSYRCSELKKDTYIIEKSGNKIGYFSLFDQKKNPVLKSISEMKFEDYQQVIAFIKTLSTAYSDADIFNAEIHEECGFISFMKSLGSETKRNYGWQVKIPDHFKFLNKIKPVLEKRFAESHLKNEDYEFYFNNFRELIKFEIKNGAISLTKESFTPKWDFNVPFEIVPKLFLGHNTIKELNEFYPDCSARLKILELINILFPKTNSYFYQVY